MRKLSLFQLLLLFPAFLLLLLFLAFCGLVLLFAPPEVAGAAFGVAVVLCIWFVLVRRPGISSGSESSLLRQSSKDGLL